MYANTSKRTLTFKIKQNLVDSEGVGLDAKVLGLETTSQVDLDTKKVSTLQVPSITLAALTDVLKTIREKRFYPLNKLLVEAVSSQLCQQ